MFISAHGFVRTASQNVLFFQDELARVLVTLFDSRHLLYQLLWNMFSKEVELADSMQTLFRGNSLASKIMTFCFKVNNNKRVNSDECGPRDVLCVSWTLCSVRCTGRRTCRSYWNRC